MAKTHEFGVIKSIAVLIAAVATVALTAESISMGLQWHQDQIDTAQFVAACETADGIPMAMVTGQHFCLPLAVVTGHYQESRSNITVDGSEPARVAWSSTWTMNTGTFVDKLRSLEILGPNGTFLHGTRR